MMIRRSRTILLFVLVSGAAIAAIATIWRAFVLAMTFDEGVLREYPAINEVLPQQTAWWLAQEACRQSMGIDDDNNDATVVQAVITRRRTDGLIVIKPLGWYVYYVRGENFYYLTSTFSSRRPCAMNESAAMVLTPVEGRHDDNDHTTTTTTTTTTVNRPPTTCCLGCTRLELINTFAHPNEDEWLSRVIPLDDAIATIHERNRTADDEKQGGVTLIDLLNYLIDQRIL